MAKKNFIKKKRILLSRIVIAALGVFIILSDSKWENIGIWSTVFFLAGVVLVGTATIGRLWCSIYISGYKSETLITEGPYSLCRNPLYFFSFLGAAGVGLAAETLLIPLFIIVFFLIYYPFVIREEQKRLLKIHGESFEQYCRTTPVFWPSLKSFKEPEQYPVNARIYRKSLFDALWFVWLVGLLELIEAFHECGLVPVLIKIY